MQTVSSFLSSLTTIFAAAPSNSSEETSSKQTEIADAEAQFRLGRCYENGTGRPQDYQKAADQGYAKAQNNLGGCYPLPFNDRSQRLINCMPAIGWMICYRILAVD